MHTHLRPISTLTLRLSVVFALLAGAIPPAAFAVPPIGFVENFPGTSLGGWGGGSLYDNPGTGGVGGAGDGYLLMWTPTASNLGAVVLDPPYPGNWSAAGIQVVKASFNDVGIDEPIVIHFIIANAFTIWQYDPSFSPPHNAWGEYTIDLTNSANWSRLTGTASYAQTLANIDRIHFRHDVTPYIHPPDPIKADVGMDRVIVTNFATPTVNTSWGRIKKLYR